MTDNPKRSDKKQGTPFEVVHGQGDPPEPDAELEPDDDRTEQEKVEDFWAGRNHAMRRSARSAA